MLLSNTNEDAVPDAKEILGLLLSSADATHHDDDVRRLLHRVSLASEINPSLFGTDAVRDCLTVLFPRCISTESIRWMCSCVCNITFRHRTHRAIFGTEEFTEALLLALSSASNDDQVRLLSSAVCSMTAERQNQDLFADYPHFVEIACDSAAMITSADAARWWCAMCNIAAQVEDYEMDLALDEEFLSKLFSLCKIITDASQSCGEACRSWLSLVGCLSRHADDCREAISNSESRIIQILAVVNSACQMAKTDLEVLVSVGKAAATVINNLCQSVRSREALLLAPTLPDCWLSITTASAGSPEALQASFICTCNLTRVATPSSAATASSSSSGSYLSLANSAAREALLQSTSRVLNTQTAVWCFVTWAQVFSACDPATINHVFNQDHVASIFLDVADRTVKDVESAHWFLSAVSLFCERMPREDDGNFEVLPHMPRCCFASLAMRERLLSLCRVCQETPSCTKWWASCLFHVARHARHLFDGASTAAACFAFPMESLCSDETVGWILKASAFLAHTQNAGNFSNRTVRGALLAMVPAIQEAETSFWFFRFMSSTVEADSYFQELWGTPEVRDAVATLGTRCAVKSQRAIAEWGILLCNLTAHNSANVGLMTSSPELAGVLAEVGLCAKAPQAIQWLCSAICNLTTQEYESQMWIGQPSVVASILHMCVAVATQHSNEKMKVPLGSRASPFVWLCRAFTHMSFHPLNQKRFATVDAADAIRTLGTKALCDEDVLAYCTVLCNLCGTLSECRAVFATASLRDVLSTLATHVELPETVVWWASAVNSLASHSASRKWFTTRKISRAIKALAAIATSDESIQWLLILMTNIAGAVTISSVALDDCEHVLHTIIRRVGVHSSVQEWVSQATATVERQRANQEAEGRVEDESIMEVVDPLVVTERRLSRYPSTVKQGSR